MGKNGVRYPSGTIFVGGTGVAGSKKSAPSVSCPPTGNQPTACTVALWWLKFGPTGRGVTIVLIVLQLTTVGSRHLILLITEIQQVQAGFSGLQVQQRLELGGIYNRGTIFCRAVSDWRATGPE